MDTHKRTLMHIPALLAALLLLAAFYSCAKMGQPDGGWYDETPPRIVGCSPADKGVNVKQRKIYINFDEYVKMDNATEKVVVSPPQMEAPDIKAEGKRISVSLKDSLKANTTYTVDFSDAISDNNEGNPLGNYTYSFSTGDEIDTMQVAGHVVDASNLEPVKGILVGLYNDLSDSAFTTKPMLRVARTDSRGIFVIKGVKPGKYRIYALQDMDGNYMYSQKSEMLAFNDSLVVPTFKPDVRQDTIWRDSLRIDSIARVNYTHFLPDNIVLRAFTETLTDRYLVKTDRTNPDRFSLYFSYGNKQLPRIKGLNFDEKDAFVIEKNQRCDSLTYWLRDTTLVNQDTLRMELQYLMTDSTGNLVWQTDTTEMLSKTPYSRRMKDKQKEVDKWKKKQEKLEKDGMPFEKEYPVDPLDVKYDAPSVLDPDKNVAITMPAPLARCDTMKLHLYAKHDTLWYRTPFVFRQDTLSTGRRYQLLAEWRPGVEYSLEVDSAAFTDIYGKKSNSYKQGFKVGGEEDYATLIFSLSGINDTAVVVQLLDQNDNVVKQVNAAGGTAELFYLKPGSYYARMFVDANRNGVWDTGNYERKRQAETVYYYPEKIECKAKWDVTRSWNPTSRDVCRQKPTAITKQKADQKKSVKRRNEERARKLGIQYIPKI